MTYWTEDSIRRELDGHLYSMKVGEFGSITILDLLNDGRPPEPKNKHIPWSDEEYKTLWMMKRRGFTVDQIECDMKRDRRAISQVWNRRLQWRDKVFEPRPDPVHLDEIVRAVCAIFQVGRVDFISERRTRKVCEARQVYYWIARKFTTRSYPAIGTLAGNKDHTTVMHGVQKLDEKFDAYRTVIEMCLFDLGLDIAGLEKEAA